MSIEVKLRCDHIGCSATIEPSGSGFDSYKETLEEMLEPFHAVGWLIQGRASQPSVYCPDHVGDGDGA